MTTKKIRFVTDTTCDLPAEVVARYGITELPCFINYNNGSFADDGIGMSREQFYHDMPNLHPHPTTSAMSPGLAEEAITKAAQDADHLFIVSVASKLSGVYNALRLGASKLPPEKYTLIDSESVTMGLGFQVLIGAETAEATGDVDAVKDAVLRVRENQHVYAALETLDYLRRSGRVGWAAAGIGSLLHIKPILHVTKGEVHSVARVRTFARAIDEMVTLVELHQPLDRIALMYALNDDVALQLRERLTGMVTSEIFITRITPAIGVHIGPQGVGVTTLSSSWRG